MANVRDLLRNFKRDEYWWSGEVALNCWGKTLIPMYLDIENPELEPTNCQIHILESLLDKSDDIRPDFEAELFRHYLLDVYRSMAHYSREKGFYGEEEITPPIKSSHEIWSLISEPAGIWIPVTV